MNESRYYLDGSYTVEAPAIFGITIGIIFLMITLGFRVYHTYCSDICAYEISDDNPTDKFRLITYGKELLEEVFE